MRYVTIKSGKYGQILIFRSRLVVSPTGTQISPWGRVKKEPIKALKGYRPNIGLIPLPSGEHAVIANIKTAHGVTSKKSAQLLSDMFSATAFK